MNTVGLSYSIPSIALQVVFLFLYPPGFHQCRILSLGALCLEAVLQ